MGPEGNSLSQVRQFSLAAALGGLPRVTRIACKLDVLLAGGEPTRVLS